MFSHRLNLIIYLDITIYLLIKWFSDKLILTTVLNKSLFEWNSQASTLRLNHQIIYTLAMERIELILRWRKYSEFQSFRWALVGVFTNSLDYVIFLLIFYRFNSILIANFISTLIATTLNYLIHHHWTFKTSQTLVRSGFKYFINLFSWWIISTILIKILLELDVDPRISKLVPLTLVIPINFFILKLYVFKK